MAQKAAPNGGRQRGGGEAPRPAWCAHPQHRPPSRGMALHLRLAPHQRAEPRREPRLQREGRKRDRGDRRRQAHHLVEKVLVAHLQPELPDEVGPHRPGERADEREVRAEVRADDEGVERHVALDGADVEVGVHEHLGEEHRHRLVVQELARQERGEADAEGGRQDAVPRAGREHPGEPRDDAGVAQRLHHDEEGQREGQNLPRHSPNRLAHVAGDTVRLDLVHEDVHG
mmetsp:Transcript_70747/g.199784  ORF Transcript_70747/g.199784 Transcript_70747/m.199784 type:complete len:229 (+) Transcript_70747:46-732(+)